MNDVRTACQFLSDAKMYYLATAEGDQPHVRIFGTQVVYKGRLYIQTGLRKNVAKQMLANPKIEICAFRDGKWIRITAKAVYDPSSDAQKAVLESFPELKEMYAVDDGNTAVFYLKNAKAVISSFTNKPEEFEF